MRWSDDELLQLERLYPLESIERLENHFDRSYDAIRRKAHREDIQRDDDARLIHELADLRPNVPYDTQFAHFVSGLVVGEGSFNRTERPNRAGRYKFSIALCCPDDELLKRVQEFFGVGSVSVTESRQKGWSPEGRYDVQSVSELVRVIIPFFDRVGLQDSVKQVQYEDWKSELFDEFEMARNIEKAESLRDLRATYD